MIPAAGRLNELHPYQQNEAARKIMNNLTTVSNSFAVWVTVAYFEAGPDIPAGPGLPNIVQVGREYYRETPADTRFKFFAVVDRSNVGLDPANYQAFLGGDATRPLHATARPFFTTVEPTSPPSLKPGAVGNALNFAAASPPFRL